MISQVSSFERTSGLKVIRKRLFLPPLQLETLEIWTFWRKRKHCAFFKVLLLFFSIVAYRQCRKTCKLCYHDKPKHRILRTQLTSSVKLTTCFYESTNFWTNIFFSFSTENYWVKKICRFVFGKFVKTCRDLDNSYKAWIFPEKNGLKLRTPELDPKQPLLSREPLPFTLLSKLRTQFLLCTSIAKKVKVKYRFF